MVAYTSAQHIRNDVTVITGPRCYVPKGADKSCWNINTTPTEITDDPRLKGQTICKFEAICDGGPVASYFPPYLRSSLLVDPETGTVVIKTTTGKLIFPQGVKAPKRCIIKPTGSYQKTCKVDNVEPYTSIDPKVPGFFCRFSGWCKKLADGVKSPFDNVYMTLSFLTVLRLLSKIAMVVSD
jgi:hypothetical protein